MKKLFLGLSLAVSLATVPVFADFKDFDDKDLAEMGVTKEYCEAFEHSLVLLDKALKAELSEIAEQLKQETFSSNEAKLVRMSELIKPKRDTLASKAAQCIKYDMTSQECEIVKAFLRDLKAVSTVTSHDLSAMLESLSRYNEDEDFNGSFSKAVTTYCPRNLLKRMENHREPSFEAKKALMQEFEQVDLRDKTLNTVKKILCTGYIISRDFNLVRSFDRNLLLQQWFYLAGSSISIAISGFDDGYFELVWAEEVKKTGIIFDIMHPICTQVLKALE